MTSTTYYPEMGGKPDAAALFEAFHVINGRMALRWRPERDAEARAAFKRNKVRPNRAELSPGVKKGPRWGATCTYEAYRKLYDAGLVCREALLD
jgi:hypothetical protein